MINEKRNNEMSKGKQRLTAIHKTVERLSLNLYKKQMKEQDIQVPKSINIDKITRLIEFSNCMDTLLIFAW